MRRSDEAGASAIEMEIAALGGLPLASLREHWEELFGNRPPKSLRREFLVKACAHQIQVKAIGGLSAGTKRRLRAVAEAARRGSPASPAAAKIKPGTRFIRSWGGATHVVTALDRGYEYRGQAFGSLSAIARAITGPNWNGRVFFGAKRRGRGTPAAAARSADRSGVDRGAAGAEKSIGSRANASQPARRGTMPPLLLGLSLPTELING